VQTGGGKEERALRKNPRRPFFQSDWGATYLFLWRFSLLASSSQTPPQFSMAGKNTLGPI
jgi:hypothetical protein